MDVPFKFLLRTCVPRIPDELQMREYATTFANPYPFSNINIEKWRNFVFKKQDYCLKFNI